MIAGIEHIFGNTGRIVIGGMTIPFYHLGGGRIVLMDSGLSAQQEVLDDLLAQHGLTVRAVLTTHAHYDHVGNHEHFRNTQGAEIIMTAFDAGITHSPLTLQACFYADTVSDLARMYPFMICKADRILPPGAGEVEIDGAVFRILDLPGHAHHHVGYVTPDGAAYLGDLLMGEEDLKIPMLFGQCWTKSLESIDRVCESSYPVYILAHNTVCADIHPLAQRNRAVILAQIEDVAACMKAPTLREDVIAAMAAKRLRRITKEKLRTVVRMTDSCMNYLEDIGRLEWEIRDNKLYYCVLPTSKEEKL